jgi:hypothetical protein
MRIGIDIDGCVRDIHDKLIKVYKREMGVGRGNNGGHWCDPPEKWYEYEISKHFSIGKGIYDFWFKTHVEEIYTKALSYPNLYEIKKLHEEGDDIIILTDQPNQATTIYTLEWILKHISYAKEIHFTPDKGKVKCDIYLDDAPHHIKNIVSHGGDIVIMDHKWNENIYAGKHAVDLQVFARIIRELR